MKPPVFNEKRARQGTNVRRNPVPAHNAAQLSARADNFQKALTLYRKHCRKLFNNAERRTAAALILAARQELQRRLLASGADASAHTKLKVEQRKKLDRELLRSLPNFRLWQQLTRDYVRYYRKVARLGIPQDLQLGLFGDFDIELVDAREHVPPFPLYDTQLVRTDNTPVVNDSSVVVPDNGHMMNRFNFDHDGETGWTVDGWFQLHRAVLASQSVACGINYAVPRAGRLQIHATLQNYASRVFWSVTDRFGFSYGNLLVEQRLLIRIIRRDRSVVTLATTLLASGVLDSPGIDAASLLPVLDNSLPYDLEGITEEVFAENENVQIFVGSEIFISSDLNDMVSHVDALVWWHLQQLSVSVA